MRTKLSAVVISYNRERLIGAVLSALRFADELILIDKSSTDGTRAVAATLAHKVVTVPWSPTVEETRAFAIGQCAHDWILLLDDDECLNPEAVAFIEAELAAPRADIYAFPLRHYVLGRHRESAYYWPETHRRLFRREAMAIQDTVHGGLMPKSDRIFAVPIESGVCIHHLSHRSAWDWIEKTNRYTSRPDRARVEWQGGDLRAFAHARIDHWVDRGKGPDPDGYAEVVGLLRAIYDMVDRIKTWEEQQGLDGDALFTELCLDLTVQHARRGSPG